MVVFWLTSMPLPPLINNVELLYSTLYDIVMFFYTSESYILHAD